MPRSLGVVSLESINVRGHFVRHRGFLGELTPITNDLDRDDSTFNVVPGLIDPRFVTFEAINFPGFFLRHQDFLLKLQEPPFAHDTRPLPPDKAAQRKQFFEDATFILRLGLADPTAVSFRSFQSFGDRFDRFIRHRDFKLVLDHFGDPPSGEQTKNGTFRVVAPNSSKPPPPDTPPPPTG